MFSKALTPAALALLASLVSAQTYTSCDPTKKSCPADPALGGSVSIDFTKGANALFGGAALTYDPALGAVFKIENQDQSPTLTSNKYIFFGRVEVEVQASVGVGVVTSLVLQSDCLDEIDWEWLGGDFSKVQLNYFSKGDTSSYDRGSDAAVSNPQTAFHTYTIDWTEKAVQWSINGAVVRTLTYADAKGGATYPQTPMQIKLGTWVAGSGKNAEGTIKWAGGLTDFNQGPFYGYYRKLTITDYGNGVKGAKEYVYGDQSGTYQSIKVVGGGANSTDDTTTTSSSSSKITSTSTSSSSSSTSTAVNTTMSRTNVPTVPTSSTTPTPTSNPNAAGRLGSSMSGLALVGALLFSILAL